MDEGNTGDEKKLEFKKIFGDLIGTNKIKRYYELQKNLDDLELSVGVLEACTSKGVLPIKRRRLAKRGGRLNPIISLTKNVINRPNSYIKKNDRYNYQNSLDKKSANIKNVYKKIQKPEIKSYKSRNETNILESPQKKSNIKNIFSENNGQGGIFVTNVNFPQITQSYNINLSELINMNNSNDNDNELKFIYNKNEQNKDILPLIDINRNNTLAGNDNSFLNSDRNNSADQKRSSYNNNIDNTPENKEIKKRNFLYSVDRQIMKNKLYINTEKNYPKLNSIMTDKKITNANLPKISERLTLNMKKENKKIVDSIKKGINLHGLMSWEIQSKFKFLQWRFGIADINKYFVDLKAFGKPEEDELEKRKTFYERVEDMIADIKEIRRQKEIEEIGKKFGTNLKKEEKIVKGDKNIEDSQNAKNKEEEGIKFLKEINARKKKEHEKREMINEIFFKSDKIIKMANKSSIKDINNNENN